MKSIYYTTVEKNSRIKYVPLFRHVRCSNGAWSTEERILYDTSTPVHPQSCLFWFIVFNTMFALTIFTESKHVVFKINLHQSLIRKRCAARVDQVNTVSWTTETRSGPVPERYGPVHGRYGAPLHGMHCAPVSESLQSVVIEAVTGEGFPGEHCCRVPRDPPCSTSRVLQCFFFIILSNDVKAAPRCRPFPYPVPEIRQWLDRLGLGLMVI